jgi:hypothetical protein
MKWCLALIFSAAAVFREVGSDNQVIGTVWLPGMLQRYNFIG